MATAVERRQLQVREIQRLAREAKAAEKEERRQLQVLERRELTIQQQQWAQQQQLLQPSVHQQEALQWQIQQQQQQMQQQHAVQQPQPQPSPPPPPPQPEFSVVLLQRGYQVLPAASPHGMYLLAVSAVGALPSLPLQERFHMHVMCNYTPKHPSELPKFDWVSCN